MDPSMFKNIKFPILILFCLALVFGCKKSKEEIPALETGTVSDNDGNTYKTVKIGNQWWMAEDLQTTKYRDSSFISLVTSSDTTWAMRTAGAYCNNMDAGLHLLGRFY